MKKLFGIVITIIVLVSVIIFSDKDEYTIRSVSYNGDNLKISIDGVVSDTLPTSGNYYLIDYYCSSVNTKLSWDKDNYELDVTNGGKEGIFSCYLDFSSKMPLSKVEVGSYVAYTGNNGCVGDYCSGKNANSSDTNNGYCSNSTYEFNFSGWRIAYVKDDSTYLVSSGSPECLCTNSDGSTSSSSCSSFETTDGAPKHIENLNNTALKYCNSNYAKGGVCNDLTAWAMNGDNFEILIGNNLSYCRFNKSKLCGVLNELIDNGGIYWYGTPSNGDSSYQVYYWEPTYRCVDYGEYFSNFAHGVRPVLSLESSVVVVGGKGTEDDPYQIANNYIMVGDGSGYVNSSNVTLDMVSTGEISTMCVSLNTSGCDNYIEYSNSYTLDLSLEDDGEKIVYTYYKDSDGKLVASMSRSFILDTVAPSNNTVSIGEGAGLNRTLTISSDGADYMCFSNTSSDVNNCTVWVEYSDSYNWRLSDGIGSKTVYSFFKDKAGNISSTSSNIEVTSIVEFMVNEDFSDNTFDSNITINGSGDYPWEVVNGRFQNTNQYACDEVGVDTESTSTIQFASDIDVTLSFDYGVMSEEGWDKLTITLTGSDGSSNTLVDELSGCDYDDNDNYIYITGNISDVSLTAGVTYTLTLNYHKDSSAYEGDDTAYIDNLVIE